jgi:hypothetical protein
MPSFSHYFDVESGKFDGGNITKMIVNNNDFALVKGSAFDKNGYT